MSVAPRNVTPAIAWIRNFLNRRKLQSVHRFQDEIAPRSPPGPILPEGPSHRLSKNWYCDRDARRTCAPPQNALGVQALEAGGEKSAAVASSVPRPGTGYDWTAGGNQYSK